MLPYFPGFPRNTFFFAYTANYLDHGFPILDSPYTIHSLSVTYIFFSPMLKCLYEKVLGLVTRKKKTITMCTVLVTLLFLFFSFSLAKGSTHACSPRFFSFFLEIFFLPIWGRHFSQTFPMLNNPPCFWLHPHPLSFFLHASDPAHHSYFWVEKCSPSSLLSRRNHSLFVSRRNPFDRCHHSK